MEIITIVLGATEDGKPIMELRHSEGVNAADGAQACRAAARQFDELRIRAEVAARLEAAAEESDD